MAGGRDNSKRSGNLDRTRQWLCHHQLYISVTPELPSSRKFKEYRTAEESRIVAKSAAWLQDNILRLLYSNLDFSQEEQSLVQILLNASPLTIQLVNTTHVNDTSNFSKRCEKSSILDNNQVKNIEEEGNTRRYVQADVSPTLSEMADSGLETGSVSPHENTTSENSSTDFEELHGTECASTNEDLNKICVRQTHKGNNKALIDAERYDSSNNCSGSCRVRDLVESTLMECTSNEHSATCSSIDAEHPHLDSSSSSTENAQKAKLHADEVYQYENQVLSDPFYESDCGSDENGSFEFIDPSHASLVNTDAGKEATKCESAGHLSDGGMFAKCTQAKSTVSSSSTAEVSCSSDLLNRTSSCNSTNYYFIDASTLNDEIDIPTTNMAKGQSFNGKPHVSSSYVSFGTDCNRSNNPMEEQCYKFTSVKMSNLQTGQENVAEFERELKLTEYLEPLADVRKVKRVDSISEDKAEASVSMDKESLVVEIKEADSGESAHPSPCPDNNSSLNNDQKAMSQTVDNDQSSSQIISNETDSVKEPSKTDSEENNRRPSLIRQNTFELDSNDEKLSLLRQEYERRQGSLVFQHAIPQYSGHRVDGDSFNAPANSSIPSINDPLPKFTSDTSIPATAQFHTISYMPLDTCKYDMDKSQNENNFLPQSSNASKSITVFPMTKSASEKIVMESFVQNDDASNNCCTSLPITLSCIIEKESRSDMFKRTKRDEATPIISGGVSTSDYSKPTDSPTVRRKTESTPIVSGGSVIMTEPEHKSKPPRMSSSMTAWVVDMSDCNKSDTRSLASTSHTGMSQSFSTSECVKKPVRKLSNHEKHGSLGFFVNLKDMDTKKVPQQESTPDKKEHNGNNKPYCEFYVGIPSKNNHSKAKRPEKEDVNSKSENLVEKNDKKNIFSMFIDLNDPHESTESNGRPSHRRSLSTFSDKPQETKLESTSYPQHSSLQEDSSIHDAKTAKEKPKPSIFMFIESDSPVVRRRTLSSSRPAFKRHSWNVDKTQSVNGNGQVAKELMFRKEHKRAHSLSVDRGELKRLQAKPSASSHSLNDPNKVEPEGQKNVKLLHDQENNTTNMDTSTEDVFDFDVRDTPPNSHVEIINEELRVSIKQHEYKELKTSEVVENPEAADTKVYEDEFSETSGWEKTCTESTEGQTRKSETFDISSGSGPSPGSDNHDYELSDILNGEVPNMSERPQIIPPVGNKISETHKSLNETIKKIESELKSPEYGKPEPAYDSQTSTSDKSEKNQNRNLKELQLDSAKPTCSNFVRLSDLDKTPVACHASDLLSVTDERTTYRMSNSIPETSWIESKLVMSRTNGSVRPLPRKFTSVMSTSLPPKQKSPLEDLTGEYEGEGIISESDLSSMQSSMGRSGAGSTEETETSSLVGGKPYNRLGEDLLRMFLEEINPDVTIDVAGRRIRAHKCILSSRCQYFAAILSGGWIENAGNVISLQGYSYNAVHFALCHIYSGESNIPDSISIVELATLADMLCLEGLKEVIGYTLKVKYCHLFHKPCQICAVGVLECMPLAAAYGLDEVYRKSLRWITRHFVRIWPCKAFATLPRELMEKCYHQHIVHMSTDNVLQTMMDCDKLLATLPNVRWAEPVFRMVSNLLETSVKFLSDNFAGVLGNENFQSLGRELTWNISRLEDNFLAAAERLPPEQACKSYSKLHKMLSASQMDDPQMKLKWGPLFVDFLKKIQSRVEKCLIRDAARAARTTMWLKMDLELRRRIQELACLVILPHETSKRQSRHSNFIKEPRATSNRSTTSRSLDLKRVKMVISEHNDKTLKQMTTTQPAKKILNKPKSDPLERKMQEDKQVAAETTIRPKSWPNKIEVKSRYLEPRNKSVPKDTVAPPHQEKVIVQQRRKIMISSSDSSRTSSPAMKRATEKKPLAKIKLPVKKDVKALSSDSLTDPNASKPNNRKDLISKSCGITRPESPSYKQKGTDIGLSVDSLAETKNKVVPAKKKPNKMDTSMSTDSLMTEITTTPRSNVSNKLSPTLAKGASKSQIYDRVKKSSPPMQQRSPLTVTRRPLRSLESSTAASRSRAAAISAYHGSPSLRRNLLDAAKTPDIPSKSSTSGNAAYKAASVRQALQSTTGLKRERRADVASSQQGSESPGKRSSPKSSGTNRPGKSSSTVGKRVACKATEEKAKSKCHNGDAGKQQPTVGSRSGTFLKDEPTILKKTDIKTSQIDT
ncbi:hypothetical protein KM043_010748 [Ampulex compressa]|nr:hypothetical protein KM043_010748 [Ampulex compressa]